MARKRLPMSAKEQLLIAREHGHVLSIETRGPWPEHNDPHPKYVLHCTCGYSSRTTRSRTSINATMGWHLSNVIAEVIYGGDRRVNGG